MTNTKDSYSFDSPDIINFAVKYFKPIMIVTIIGAIVSIIVALTIQPRFKSTVILFPASSSSVSGDLLSMNNSRKGILQFGGEEEVEQMLQVLQSDEIRNKIFKKFNLLEHYEIDSASEFKLTKLQNEFASNVSFRRTEFMSVEIAVLDADPQIAADIANTIAALVDTTMTRMQRERAQLALKIIEDEYFVLIDQIKLMEDSLTIIRAKGINNYESQSEVFNDAYAKAIIQGKSAKDLKIIEEKLEILSKYGGAYVSLRDRLIYETERLSNLKSKYLEAKIDAENELPHKFIVDSAIKAEKKSKPVRWLIVVLSTFSSFVFALVFLIVFDLLKDHSVIREKLTGAKAV